MAVKKKLSKWFGGGYGHAVRYVDSDTVLFSWNGKSIGLARYIPHVKLYARNGVEYRSLAALLRGVAAEQTAAA